MKSQSLEKMFWFNEPEQWEIKNNSLVMQVTPKSDLWRISHYSFLLNFIVATMEANLRLYHEP